VKLISLAGLFVALAAVVSGQVDPQPPTPVPFTAEPKQVQWRLGFDLGNAVILETPELNPDDNPRNANLEAERVLHSSFLDFGLALLPVSKVNVRTSRLVNPRQWTVLDLRGKTSHRSFQALGVFMGRRMTSTEGGYHLVSVPALPDDAFLGVRHDPAPQEVIFGFAGPLKKTQIHARLSETKWENLLPVEDAAFLPAGYESAKSVLDDHPTDGQQRFLFGTSIEAFSRNRPAKFWLLNYSHPDTTIGAHPWGIFVEENGGLRPVYVYKPDGSGEPFVAYFTAALDLNQDGTDEFIVEASYRIGTAFKVISETGGKYQETFTSYYRGPAS